MASLYPLDRKAFLLRMGQALRDTRLGAQLLAFLDHSGERTQIALIAGGAAGAHTVTGLAEIDRLISVHEQDGTTGLLTDLTSEFAVSGLSPDTIDNTGGTDTTGDTLLVSYGDRSP
jgi:hypothetical protein